MAALAARCHAIGAPLRRRAWWAASSLTGRSLEEAMCADLTSSGISLDASQEAAARDLSRWDAEAEAAAAAGACAMRPWAYIYGPVGSGKTMLLDAYHRHKGPMASLTHVHELTMDVQERLHAHFSGEAEAPRAPHARGPRGVRVRPGARRRGGLQPPGHPLPRGPRPRRLRGRALRGRAAT
mmetsp:Transcript_21563/g.72565  ORF Transcript_21563/g.72565 Transcript_21563/m.72565 type:complete len:182 (+) Transcript_21563:29-574(+)